MLRTKFATELHLTVGGGVGIGQGVPMLMHFDGLLLTGDGSAAGGVSFLACYGFANLDTNMGIAAVNFGAGGFGFELGSACGFEGPGPGDVNMSPLIAVGCGNAGAYAGQGLYIGDGAT